MDLPKYYIQYDSGINYYTCSSKINGCEECSYDDSSFNKFHCTKCSSGLDLSETYECIVNNKDIDKTISFINIEINRSRAHSDQTGDLTPLVVSLSCPDKNEKVTGVDLICIVDVSGSMYGTNIKLVKESLTYLVNLMNEQDNFALVTFSSSSYVKIPLTKMTSENKKSINYKIDQLDAYGGTNIYSELEIGLSLINDSYLSGERAASMILLSDGEDNYDFSINKFKNLISVEGKSNYAFTLHSFGYGDYHDSYLMNEISKIRDGSYFYIQRLVDVQDAYVKIYGALSTVCSVNLILNIKSNYRIEKVYGMEDMYEASLINNNLVFKVKLIQVIYGKKYNFVVLVEIPKYIKMGTQVLNTTASNANTVYLLSNSYSNYAYEEYIRYNYISNGYEKGEYYGPETINEGIDWIKKNYNGTRNWEGEFKEILFDYDNYDTYGEANILSKVRELKTSQIGIHYNEENSYIINIVDRAHGIDVNNLQNMIVYGEKIINFEYGKNYYYFYLKEGVGKINNILYSGSGSSFIIYTDETTGNINITSLTEYIDYYYWNETKTNRIQTIIDFSEVENLFIKKIFLLNFIQELMDKEI